MKPIFCIIGKTGAGKSTLYDLITRCDPFNLNMNLKGLVYSTTRPPRANEVNGIDYNFKSIDEMNIEKERGEIIELRHYDTADYGITCYYTTKSEMNIENCNGIVCAVSVDQAIEYLLKDYPIYFIIIETPIKVRMKRVINREGIDDNNCLELCRRILEETNEFNKIYSYIDNTNSITITNEFDNNDEVIEIEGKKYLLEEISKVYSFMKDIISSIQ